MDQTDWASIAGRSYWFDQERCAWLRCGDGGVWRGWTVPECSAVAVPEWTFCKAANDTSEHPYVTWFPGGVTNMAWNEVDAAVVAGMSRVAFVHVPDDSGVDAHVTIRAVFEESARRAEFARREFGLDTGDRVTLHISNILESAFWIQACRMGISTHAFSQLSNDDAAWTVQKISSPIVSW